MTVRNTGARFPRPVMHTGNHYFLHGLFFVCCLLCISCVTVKEKPFEKFSQSITEARTGLMQSLESNHLASRERFKRDALKRYLEGDPTLVEKLRIHPTEDPLGLNISQGPFFLTSAQFKNNVDQMTAVILSYAQLLLQLASPDLIPKETFDTFAKQLNDSAYNVATAIRGEHKDGTEIAILSTAAARILEEYIQYKRQSELKKALISNQSTVEEFTRLIHQAIFIAALSAQQEYDSQLFELELAFDPQKERRALDKHVKDLEELLEQQKTEKSRYEAQLQSVKNDLENDSGNDQLKNRVKELQYKVNRLNAQIAESAITLAEAKRQADRGPKIKTPDELNATLESMMALNEAYVEYMEVLRKISLLFESLPAAHRELAHAVDGDQEGLEAINSLLKEGIRLQAVYSRNRLANDIKTAQAQADVLTARADELDARITSEELRKSNLEISLNRAKSKYASDPDNENLKKEIQELDNRIAVLDDRIKRLKLLQTEAHSRASAAQTEVDQMKGTTTK